MCGDNGFGGQGGLGNASGVIDCHKPIETDSSVKIEWGREKDEYYYYFGKCPCGNSNVLADSKFCSQCGKIIVNPFK